MSAVRWIRADAWTRTAELDDGRELIATVALALESGGGFRKSNSRSDQYRGSGSELSVWKKAVRIHP